MSRDITMCHPKLQNLASGLVIECKKQGLLVKIGECFRTVAKQDALYSQGRTKPGKIVTYARGNSYSSMHQWGVAFDVIRNDGKGAYNDTDGWFNKVGKIGQALGLEWGGIWTSPVDKPHFQLADWGSSPTKLKKLYGTVGEFKKTWVKEVDTEVVTQTKININGKEYNVNRILKDGKNYIELAGLKQAGFDIGYNQVTKIPSFGVSTLEDVFLINDERTKVNKIIKNGENYVRLRDLESVCYVDYATEDKMVILDSK